MVAEVTVPVRGEGRRALLYGAEAPPHGAVVVVHGSGPGSSEEFADYAGRLAGLGVATLVVDKVMDGYGPLRRRYDLLAKDATETVTWLRSSGHVGDGPIALLGYSEGSWVALRAVSPDPAGVDLLVLCSAPIVSPRRQTTYHRRSTHSRPAGRLGAALTWLAMTFSDYGRHDAGPDLRALQVPALLVLGADDPSLEVDRAVEAFRADIASEHAVIIVDGAGHQLPAGHSWLSEVAGRLRR